MQIQWPGYCLPTAVTLTPTRDGTKVDATFAACGLFSIPFPARLKGKIDWPTCGTLQATFNPLVRGARTSTLIATVTHGESVRFATFNTQMLPSPQNITTTNERAYRIAERIVAANYDVVVLNEVFDEDIRKRLVKGRGERPGLRATYPYYIDKLDAQESVSDGGLMLFSRFPFVELPEDEISLPELRVDGGRAGVPLNFRGDFDAGDPVPLPLTEPIKFFDSIEVRLFECDSPQGCEPFDHPTPFIQTLGPLDPGPYTERKLVLRDDDGDGEYHFVYNITHGFD